MRHEAVPGIQETLDLPEMMGMKADCSGGILDRCEGRTALTVCGGYLMWPKQGRFYT